MLTSFTLNFGLPDCFVTVYESFKKHALTRCFVVVVADVLTCETIMLSMRNVLRKSNIHIRWKFNL